MNTRLAALLLYALGTACSSASYTVRSTGAGVLTPSIGPAAMGPLTRARHPSLEGSIQVGYAGPSRTSEGGDVRVITTVGRGRIAYAISERFELAISGQATSTSAAVTTRDGSLSAPSASEALFGGGVQLRGLLAGDARLGFGVQLELAAYEAPYAAHDDYTTTRTSGAVLNRNEVTTTSSRDLQGTAVLVEPTFGAFVTFTPAARLRLVAGGTMSGRHDVVTDASRTSRCSSGLCSDTPAFEAPFDSNLQLTGHVSAGYEIGPVTLLAQFAVNAFGDAPVGASFGVRVTP